MTNGLTNTQIKILTWVVWALLFLLSGIVAWVAVQQFNMSNQYVRLERYKSDKVSMQLTLDEIREDTRDMRRLLEKIFYPGK